MNIKMKSVKGAVSPVFSITVMIQKTHVYRWESKNCGSVLLTWLFYRTDRIGPGYECRTGMEITRDSNLKLMADFFKYLRVTRIK